MGLGSEWYVDILLNRGPKGQFSDDYERDFYQAYKGDEAALKRFLASENRDIAGEPSEGWIADVVVLVLSYDDTTLHDFLMGDDSKTRRYVCYIMAVQLHAEDLQRYPKTQTLYPEAFVKRRGGSTGT